MNNQQKGKLTQKSKMNLLLSVAQSMNSASDIEEILRQVIDQVILTLRAERGFIVLANANELDFKASRGIEDEELSNPDYEISTGVIWEAINTEKVILTANAGLDERFSSNESVVDLKLKSVLCAPIHSRAGTIGAVYVENRMSVGIFDEEDIELISNIASSAAIAIDHAELVSQSIHKDKLEKDLKSAREIQKNLIKGQNKNFGKWVFSGEWIPAKEVAGDFYFVAERIDGKLLVVIADISGKGAPAAIFMYTLRDAIETEANNGSGPAEILRNVNVALAKDNPNSMFASVFLAFIDKKSGSLAFSNGGHNPGYILSKRKRIRKLDNFHGPVLGAMEDSYYEESEISIPDDSQLFLFTDGVIETENLHGDYFGYKRLEDMLKLNSTVPPRVVSRKVLAEIEEFRESFAQVDDITILTVKIPGNHKAKGESSTFRFDASFDGINEAALRIEDLAKQLKLNDSSRQEIMIVIDELVGNIVKFASNKDETEFIEITFSQDGQFISVIIVDSGKEFNPFDRLDKPLANSIQERRPGGLGLRLVEELTDLREYRRKDGTNIVSVKWLISDR